MGEPETTKTLQRAKSAENFGCLWKKLPYWEQKHKLWRRLVSFGDYILSRADNPPPTKLKKKNPRLGEHSATETCPHLAPPLQMSFLQDTTGSEKPVRTDPPVTYWVTALCSLIASRGNLCYVKHLPSPPPGYELLCPGFWYRFQKSV